MRKVFFTLIFTLLFINNAMANDASRYIEDCLSVIDKPKLKTTSSYGKLKYDFSKDEDFLRKKTNEYYDGREKVFPDDYDVLGLTTVRLGFDLDVDVNIISVSNGKHCAYPTSIKAHMGYSVPTIYILNDLKKGSCRYDVALKHEKTHMEIYIHALDYVMPMFKAAVERLFDEVGVRIIDKPNSDKEMFKVAEGLSNDYRDHIKKQIDVWWKKLHEEHDKLDTLESYKLEARICEEIDKE